MRKVLIYFFVNYHLLQFVVVFSTLAVTFLTLFAAQWAAFSGLKNLYMRFLVCKSSIYTPLLHLMTQLGRVRRAWKLYQSFEICSLVCPPIVTATAYYLRIWNTNCHVHFWCPYIYICMVSSNWESNENYFENYF